MSKARHRAGTPAGGQFRTTPRGEATPSLIAPSPDPRDAFLVVDGQCINCGHYDDHWWCENCSPSCTECGMERESPDRSLCDYCEQREDERSSHGHEEDDDPGEDQ